MPLKELRVKGFRAFKDSGVLAISPITAIVGRNDTGKSALLYALKWFFEPPKKGGIPGAEMHCGESASAIEIELAFDPSSLISEEIKIDAKNTVAFSEENLLDKDGLLRLRLTFCDSSSGLLEIKVYDLDDPDLFGMALLKKEKDLISLLEGRGLPATPAGKETNAEKRKALREQAIQQGVALKEDWFEVGDKEKAIREVIPEFRLFTDEARFGVGETPVQNQFKGVVDRALRELPIAAEVEEKAEATLQEEFNKVYAFLSSMTDAVKGVRAKAKIDWKRAVSDVTLSWLDPFDIDVPYELRGAGIRRLFMVAYFQYEAAESLNDPEGPKYIFCLEEPEVHLHPAAQRLLIESLQLLAEAGHVVIFTTHSPVFAAMVPAESLILVSREGIAAQTRQQPDINLVDVAHELGVEAPDRLIGKSYVVLVEGENDIDFYEEALSQLYQDGYTSLDPQKVSFILCGGIGNLKYMAAVEKMEEVGLPWCALADSDKKCKTDNIHSSLGSFVSSPPASCKSFQVLERTCIENYLDSTSIKNVVGLDVIVPEYGRLCDANGCEIASSYLKKIKGNIRDICKDMGSEGLLRCSQQQGESDLTNAEFVRIFDNIRKGFCL